MFLSAKGGSGVTTLAAILRYRWPSGRGKRTLLIDLNFPLGDAALNLGVRGQYSTVNAFEKSRAARYDIFFRPFWSSTPPGFLFWPRQAI